MMEIGIEPTAGPATPSRDAELDAAIERACSRLAPSWPLDRFIAVNPLWGMIDEPVPEVSAKLTALSGSRLLMPRAYYRAQWKAGRLRREHLHEAIVQRGARATPSQLIAHLDEDEPATPHRARVMDVADGLRNLDRAMSWRELVTNETSQLCATYFDEGQAPLGPQRAEGLYATWRRHALRDRSPALLMGATRHRELARALPSDARAMVALALRELDVPAHERVAYLTGLLLDLNGWAAWCAYQRWTARLAGDDDDSIVDLLGIRLAWEWMLLRQGGPSLAARWQLAMASWPAADDAARASQEEDWLVHHAMEIAYQSEVCAGLSSGQGRARSPHASVQAVFCIDVRSEVFRRALEARSEAVQTIGFAGFFGLPIEHQRAGSPHATPQLPGLLAPRMRATDVGGSDALAARRAARLDTDAAWKALRTGSLSTFTFVDALGPFYGGALLAETFGWLAPARPGDAGLEGPERARLKPRLTHLVKGGAIELETRCDLAAGILKAMSLTRDFARVVLLVGHGSESRNNPHAAGLDCGACCGQSGEVNARAAAALLNEPAVRAGLAARGIDVPSSTWFVAAMHLTTTDEVELFDLDELPASHAEDLETLRSWLLQAGHDARLERAARLGIEGSDRGDLRAATKRRARDWAQVRPEWGLANNAAFVVAPRERTRHLSLEGRSFLHDYRAEDDADFAILELIMTAPMIVTHWINFQYFASTVDNPKLGSGNKVLHDVVGGHVGVFEGNGGDLRIGLPLQSLHDGTRWVHEPLRLSVFLEAPRDAIDGILAKHDHVRALVDHGWIHLFQIDARDGAVHARRDGAWAPAPPLSPQR